MPAWIALQAPGAGFWQFDFASRQMWATRACRAMFDLDPSAPITPNAFLAAIHPDDQAAAIEAIRVAAAVEDSETTREEFRIIRASGQVRCYSVLSSTERDATGARRISGLFEDITAERRKEKPPSHFASQIALRDEDRRRIADMLHETTTQHLVAIGINLAGLKNRLAAEKDADHLGGLRTAADKAARDLRTYTYLLRPPVLDGALCRSLQRYLSGFERSAGVTARLRLNERADSAPASVQRALLAIVQESLLYRRHAVTCVAVDVRCIGRCLHLIVSHDGQGLNTIRWSEVPSGDELDAMHEHARQVGAKLTIHSGPDVTRVHACVPLD